MKPTKIKISPEVREFNEAVEHADYCLDYQFDQEPADVLLQRLQQTKCYPISSNELQGAMANLAIKRDVPPWIKTGQTPIQWAEGKSIKRDSIPLCP